MRNISREWLTFLIWKKNYGLCLKVGLMRRSLIQRNLDRKAKWMILFTTQTKILTIQVFSKLIKKQMYYYKKKMLSHKFGIFCVNGTLLIFTKKTFQPLSAIDFLVKFLPFKMITGPEQHFTVTKFSQRIWE